MATVPCYNNGNDCPRRYVGCRAKCDEWNTWLAEHEAERERQRQRRTDEIVVDSFLADGWTREQNAKRREHKKGRRR